MKQQCGLSFSVISSSPELSVTLTVSDVPPTFAGIGVKSATGSRVRKKKKNCFKAKVYFDWINS